MPSGLGGAIGSRPLSLVRKQCVRCLCGKNDCQQHTENAAQRMGATRIAKTRLRARMLADQVDEDSCGRDPREATVSSMDPKTVDLCFKLSRQSLTGEVSSMR